MNTNEEKNLAEQENFALHISEREKIEILDFFGFYVYEPIDKGYTGERFEYNAAGVYGPWKKNYKQIPEHQLQKLKIEYNRAKYYLSQKDEGEYRSNRLIPTDEGRLESTTRAITIITIALTIIGTIFIICTLMRLGMKDSSLFLTIVITSLISIFGLLLWYLVIRVFTNISLMITEIRDILKNGKFKI